MNLTKIRAQIETVNARLAALVRVAETGAQWAEICRLEAAELVPLLARRDACLEMEALEGPHGSLPARERLAYGREAFGGSR